MKSSQIITLFAEPSPPRTAPSSFLVSILVHGAGFGLLLIGLKHTSRISDPSVIQRYTVRLLTPRRTEPQTRHSAGSGVAYPDPQSVARALAPGGSPAPLPYVPPQVAQLLPASQTLVQPDAPPDLLLPQETPIPVLVMWSRDSTLSKKIVPPPPQEATVADVRPSLIKPNHESNLADLNISATAFPTVAPAVPASTTAPLVVRGPEPIKQVPQTSSQPLEQPTPARVMSISDLQTQGPVMIPLANQTSQSASTESLAPRRPEKSSGEGNGNPASKQNGIGAGQSSGDQGAKAATGGGSVAQNGADTGPGQGSDAGLGSSSEPSLTRLSLPKDGRFGVVVVGSSLAEQYPETVGIWSGRLVYTVYLHVGLGKTWILQYSLPRAEEAATAGSVIRPEAPWPYEIVRPHFAPGDFNSDAILVHGFINLAGRFERLAVVFPPEFALPKFLFGALQQWQFRAARQNGQLAAVEVLLIIPEETE